MAIVGGLAAYVQGGYHYHMPSHHMELPAVQQSFYPHMYTHIEHHVSHPEPNTISYSVSSEDYNYLKQYKYGQQSQYSSNFNSAQGFTPIVSHQNNQDVNYNGNNYDGGVSDSGHSNAIRQNSISASSVVRPNDIVSSNNGYSAGYLNIAPVQPVITKHIYFHAPPPDVEEPKQVYPTKPPKKIYNIVFIKVPSQESKNAAKLQQLVNQQASVEDKTLIYVLVKKPDPQPPQPTVPVSSQHEVFYVKYKGDAGNAVSQINENLDEVAADQNPATTSNIQPGLLNGQL